MGESDIFATGWEIVEVSILDCKASLTGLFIPNKLRGHFRFIPKEAALLHGLINFTEPVSFAGFPFLIRTCCFHCLLLETNVLRGRDPVSILQWQQIRHHNRLHHHVLLLFFQSSHDGLTGHMCWHTAPHIQTHTQSSKQGSYKLVIYCSDSEVTK